VRQTRLATLDRQTIVDNVNVMPHNSCMSDKLSNGDRVVYRAFGRSRHGVIKRLAKVSVIIAFDNGGDERVNLEQVEPETIDDVRERDAKVAIKAWCDARPERHHITVKTDWLGKINGVSVDAKTADEMREASAELLAFAAWFEKKPVV